MVQAKSSWGLGWGGGSQAVTASLAPASNLVNNRVSFSREDQPLSWREAMDYCRDHYTDLVSLQSMGSMASLLKLGSCIQSTQAWIGLFFDMSIYGPRWSSGSAFLNLGWIQLPALGEGMCVTLYSLFSVPTLGVDFCTARKPFICYQGVFRFMFPSWSSSSQADSEEACGGGGGDFH